MKAFWCAVCLSCVSLTLWSVPAQVILIRHGEKIHDGDGLSKVGFQRAGALVPFFTQSPYVTPLQTPVAIYAQGSSGQHPSVRCVETVQELAQALGLPLITKYHHGHYLEMVEGVLSDPGFEGKMVLICWNHNGLPAIAQAFGILNPPVWPSTQFDRIWIISFFQGVATSFKNLPQRLMFGDSPS